MSLFPNPAKNLLTIDVKRTSKTTYGGVFDIQGKEVIQNIQIDETGKTIVATETLETGVYIVKLKTENGETLVKKFFKE
ncbi:T9SS type A sorting domain-containing protein [Aquimarina aggregata]|uniref:T9SS type A sorting domain-containing protein n=1 Tax=Aquimarina aggregata TaxID=1642818 RepID=UPI002493B972|nr:T9SS type A sorting domain-containing protein [Aquimarina aggregata]